MVLVVFLFSFGQRWATAERVDADIAAERARLAAAAAEQDELLAEIEKLRDPAYIAILAREKLRYIRPGEQVCLDAAVSSDVLASVGSEGIIED